MKPDKDSSVGNNISFTPELLSALGTLMILFVGLEYWLMLTIDVLMPTIDAKLTFRLLGGDDFKVLLSKLKRIFLFQIKDKELLKEFAVLHKELQTIKDGRNKFLHSFWFFEKEVLNRIKLKTDIKIEPILFDKESKTTISEIHSFNKKLVAIAKDFEKLNEKIIKLLGDKSEINNAKHKRKNQNKENQKET